MKKILAFTILALVVTSLAHAKMVSYVDEAGKVHYVDTNYMKVPDRYLNQVQGQLEDTPKEVEPTVSVEMPRSGDHSSSKGSQQTDEQFYQTTPQDPILFFVENPCPKCMMAEALLGTYGVSYQKYDVNDGDMGQNKSSFLGIKSVPAIAVGKKIVYGANATAISAALKESGYRLGQTAPKQRPAYKQNPFKFKKKK